MRIRTPRTPFMLTVGLMRHGRRETAYILDISEGGLKLQGVTAPQLGETLRIHAKGALIRGQIRWIAGPLCGVQFDEAQTTSDLRRLMTAVPGLNRAARKSRPVLHEYGAMQMR